jgi:hypothetical protein
MIKISLKGLAKFMTAGAAAQRKILGDFKHPDPEGSAQARYYQEARDRIAAYHRFQHEDGWLSQQAGTIASRALASGGVATRVRLQNNARALRAYERHFGGRQFEILPDVSLDLAYAGVRVSVHPDLHVRELGRDRIVKLEFSQTKPDAKAVKIMAQGLFEAATNAGLGLSSADVLYMDCVRGVAYKGARVGARMGREIEAACQNIAALWPGI